MALSNESMMPLYQQIVGQLSSDIQSGRYAVDDKIPTEYELAEVYGVSRVTVRRAIEELTNKGYVTRKAGKGTFVNAPKLERKIVQTVEMLSFAEICEAAGKKAGARVLKTEKVKGKPREVSFLNVPKGSDLLLVQRIRTADKIPVMLENSLFPYEEFSFLEMENLNNASIFNATACALGRSPGGHTQCTLNVVRADVATSQALNVPLGEPLFLEVTDLVDTLHKPFFIAEDYIAGSLYSYNI